MADKRVVMMAVWKDSIEVETMVVMMAVLKDFLRSAVKAASWVELKVLQMIEKLVAMMVVWKDVMLV